MQWWIQGSVRGSRPPLFSDQTEARSAEKKNFWDPPLPLNLTVRMTVPPYLKVWIRYGDQYQWVTIGSLSSNVFERRTSTGSEVFSLLTCLDDIKFVFLSFFTVIEAIWLKICAKPPSKNEKRPLPVDVRGSKTLLLKLPNNASSPRNPANHSFS